MTYCVGILLRDGLVMIADTRTNAGLDNIATFKKLHVFSKPGDRVISIATAGNLAITQSVLSLLSEGVENPDTGELDTVYTQTSMFKTAQLVGRAIREVYRTDGKMLEAKNLTFEVTMLLGGQIKGGRLRLFMIYAAGNFIEATIDTPYLQIGEHKYGKPILDRAVKFDTDIQDGLKIGLISMDSTMRSNLGVGMPIDLIVVPRDRIEPDLHYRIEPGEPYFHDLRERWSAALRAAHQAIPRPPYSLG
ncbi:MAG: proteasome-type protease [Hyphomicrobiaceae bacterium]|nr:proteasome-type protease [Hyphomicrobiaceae bacterium]